MATQAQITANAGPRSADGKAVSRFNAVTHAAAAKSLVVRGEEESAFSELSGSYYEQFQPVGPEEALLLEKIIAADWTQRRMRRVEAEVFNALIAQQDDSQENPLGAAFIKDCQGPKALQQIFRCLEAASREWYRALAELRARQAERLAFASPPLPADSRHAIPEARASLAPARPPESPAPASQLPPRGKIGFVFDTSTPPAWRL